MQKTGNGILELFSLLAILLPVIPLFIVFYKKVHTIAAIQLLAIACLFGLASSLLRFTGTDAAQQHLMYEIFRGCDCTILLLLYRITATNKRIADIFNFLVICSVSIVVAIYATTGIEQYAATIRSAQSVLMIGATLLAFSQLVTRRDLLLFESTLFWIGAATFFNFSMLLLIDQIGSRNTVLQISEDKMILMYLVQFVRYLFYVIAVVITENNSHNEISRRF